MLVPLVRPKRLVVIRVALPVRVHEFDELRLPLPGEDLADVGVLAARIAVLLVRPVAVVRPQAMDRPRVVRADVGLRVPELREELEAAGDVGAAFLLARTRCERKREPTAKEGERTFKPL